MLTNNSATKLTTEPLSATETNKLALIFSQVMCVSVVLRHIKRESLTFACMTVASAQDHVPLRHVHRWKVVSTCVWTHCQGRKIVTRLSVRGCMFLHLIEPLGVALEDKLQQRTLRRWAPS